MFGIGPMELVLILVVALLVLGPKRMPDLARTLGRGLGEFRRASNELRESLAIDDIQDELRNGLTGGGPIRRPMKRPDADDPPAQAGGDLPPVNAPGTVSTRAGGPDARNVETETPPGGASDSTTPDETAQATPSETPSPTQPGPPTEAARPATSTLGSIPVGGRTPQGGVPAGDRATDPSERERG